MIQLPLVFRRVEYDKWQADTIIGKVTVHLHDHPYYRICMRVGDKFYLQIDDNDVKKAKIIAASIYHGIIHGAVSTDPLYLDEPEAEQHAATELEAE